MAKPEWGLKRTCLGCGTRFYDMKKDPIVCPSCEAEFDPLALVR
ncbi:MAG: TIGR02300 family protein, partial [Alphaproteobacteria bacterium]|nr:TIGR02300 family protein [Alphaproteobacteria bacterium]